LIDPRPPPAVAPLLDRGCRWAASGAGWIREGGTVAEKSGSYEGCLCPACRLRDASRDLLAGAKAVLSAYDAPGLSSAQRIEEMRNTAVPLLRQAVNKAGRQ
jgi:hypothetical protein